MSVQTFSVLHGPSSSAYPKRKGTIERFVWKVGSSMDATRPYASTLCKGHVCLEAPMPAHAVVCMLHLVLALGNLQPTG